MTGWWGIYPSKDGAADMLWPDMTRWFIISYDIWNFQYTYLNLPTHSWYCGAALLLAPTFAASYWNKGGWIHNRAFTLSIWFMFSQTVPTFQMSKTFGVLTSVYGNPQNISAMDLYNSAISLYNKGIKNGIEVDSAIKQFGIVANPTAQGVISILSIVSNVLVISAIFKRAKRLGINPYTDEVWVGTVDFEEAFKRAEGNENMKKVETAEPLLDEEEV